MSHFLAAGETAGLAVDLAGSGDGATVGEALAGLTDAAADGEADGETVGTGETTGVGEMLGVGTGAGVGGGDGVRGGGGGTRFSHSCSGLPLPPISLSNTWQRSRILPRSGGPGEPSALPGNTRYVIFKSSTGLRCADARGSIACARRRLASPSL